MLFKIDLESCHSKLVYKFPSSVSHSFDMTPKMNKTKEKRMFENLFGCVHFHNVHNPPATCVIVRYCLLVVVVYQEDCRLIINRSSNLSIAIYVLMKGLTNQYTQIV